VESPEASDSFERVRQEIMGRKVSLQGDLVLQRDVPVGLLVHSAGSGIGYWRLSLM